MSAFRNVSAPLTPPDPLKRVNYSLGLVLGVDEFTQEQTFFLERDRLQSRLLHGYGTASGLEVEVTGTKVTVKPGHAVDPWGRTVQIAHAQCADLEQWLKAEANQDAVKKANDDKRPSKLSLHILLSYQECETDKVPVPGGPCRSQEESLAPSRISESFSLRFALKAPDQVEEDAVRQFGELLGRIRLVESGETMGWTEIEKLLKALAKTEGALDAPDPILINRDEADGLLNRMLRFWVTSVRPAKLVGVGPAEELPISLGRLYFNLNASWKASSVKLDESTRPYLLTTRLLQEYLRRREEVTEHQYLAGLDQDDHKQYLLISGERAMEGALEMGGHKVTDLAKAEAEGEAVPFEQAIKVGDPADGDLDGTYPNPTVVGIHGSPITIGDSLAEGAVLTWQGEEWRPVVPEPPTVHGNLSGLDNDDHRQYLPISGSRAMAGDLKMGGKKITNLAAAKAAGEAMPYGQAASGDLRDTYPGPRVVALQNQPVSDQTPNPGNVLKWVGGQWTPAEESGGAIDLERIAQELPVLPFVTITRLPDHPEGWLQFELWFHLNADKNIEEAHAVSLLDDFLPEVFGETERRTLVSLEVREVEYQSRNVYRVTVTPHPKYVITYLRFMFLLHNMPCESPLGTHSLADWEQRRPMKWVGSDGNGTVTAFYRMPQDISYAIKPVAAGLVMPDGSVEHRLGGLAAQPDEGDKEGREGYFILNFPGYDPKQPYLVKGTPYYGREQQQDVFPFSVFDFGDDGILVRVAWTKQQVPQNGFMVEISALR